MIELIHAVDPSDGSDALSEVFRFRHRVFVEHARWDVLSRKGMEIDQFDTVDAVYILCRDSQSKLRGMSRLIPSTAPYMIQELWPELLDGEEPPVSPRIWEVSRFGIDPSAGPALRAQVSAELLLAGLAFGLRCGIDEYLAVPTPSARRNVMELGWPCWSCGPAQPVGSYQLAAVRMPVTRQVYECVRERASAADAAQLWSPALRRQEPAGLRIPLDLVASAAAAARGELGAVQLSA